MHQLVDAFKYQRRARKTGKSSARQKGGFTCSARAPEGRYLLYIKSFNQSFYQRISMVSTLGLKIMAKARKKCFVSANIKKCCALNIATKKVFSSEIPKSRNRFLTHLNAENIFYFYSISFFHQYYWFICQILFYLALSQVLQQAIVFSLLAGFLLSLLPKSQPENNIIEPEQNKMGAD